MNKADTESGQADAKKIRMACYALTAQGLALARKLAQGMHGEPCMAGRKGGLAISLFAPQRFLSAVPEETQVGCARAVDTRCESAFDSLPETVRTCFHHFDAHLFLTASGIAVRCIAPLLRGKAQDPAVLVCDQRARFVVSVLSGHLGGANALSRQIADFFKAQAVISTATDTEGLPSIDLLALENNCAICDLSEIKTINAALLAHEPVTLIDSEQRLHLEDTEEDLFQRVSAECATSDSVPEHAPTVIVDWHQHAPRPRLLRLVPRVLHLGLGCRQGVPVQDLEVGLNALLEERQIARKALASLSSVDLKKDEACLHELAEILQIPLHFYAASALAVWPTANPSPKAAALLGTGEICVCEGAALISAARAGQKAQLFMQKKKYSTFTLALALAL